MFSNKSQFMDDRIMWTNFKRFNESHFFKLSSKNFMVRKIFIEPEMQNPDDRNVLSSIFGICVARVDQSILIQDSLEQRFSNELISKPRKDSRVCYS